jgi:hypothetical protein
VIGTACFSYKYYIYKNDYLELKSKYSNTKKVIDSLMKKNVDLRQNLIEKQKLKLDKSINTLNIESNDLTPEFEIFDLTPKPRKIELILKDGIKSYEKNRLDFFDRSVQSDKNMVDRSIQSDKNIVDKFVQSDKNMVDRSVLKDMVDRFLQKDMVDRSIQTNLELNIDKFVQSDSDDQYKLLYLIENF